MAYDERLASRVRRLLAAAGDVEERRMFGGIAFMLNGHMCCGVAGDDLMLRLGADQAQQALEEPHVRPMDFTGRPMKGFVYVDPQGSATDAKLRHWLRLAQEFVSTLPSK